MITLVLFDGGTYTIIESSIGGANIQVACKLNQSVV